MGLFDDFNINEEDVKTNNFDIADGVYRFEVAEAERRDGTQNKPDNTYFVIDFQLENEDGDSEGSKQSWHTLAVDGDQDHRIAKIGWSTLKQLLMSLGIKGADLQGFEGPEIIGKRGTLQLKTGASKNGKPAYQNIRNVKLDEGDEVLAKPVKKAAAKPVKKAAAKPAAKGRQVQLLDLNDIEEEPDDDEEDDNPFGDD